MSASAFVSAVTRVVDREELGEFSLLPAQGPALSIFVPLSRLQQDLDLGKRVNALLVRMAAPAADPATRCRSRSPRRSQAAARLEDLGLTMRTNDAEARCRHPRESHRAASRRRLSTSHGAAAQADAPAVGALTYLANAIRARGREIPVFADRGDRLEAYDRLRGSRQCRSRRRYPQRGRRRPRRCHRFG